MSGLWNIFDENVASYLNQIYQDIDQVFRNILRVTSDAGKWASFLYHCGRLLTSSIANSDHTLQVRLNPLIATLRHRKSLLLHGVDTIIEDFQSKMSNVQTDAFSPIRTSIIGQLMDAAYNAANMEYGMSEILFPFSPL